MEDLTKQQMVLLVLLVSFITSIATSITIVSILTDSTPIITQTINRIVEKTVETVSPAAASNLAIKPVTPPPALPSESDQLIAAVQKNTGMMAVISKKGSDTVESVTLGVGFLVDGGLVATDKNILWETAGLSAAFRNGKSYSADIAYVDDKTGVALLRLHDDTDAAALTLHSVSFSNDQLVLGQSVLSLGGKTGAVLAKGILTDISASSDVATSTASALGTTIVLGKSDRGASLFDMKGNVVGMAVTSSAGDQYFVPASLISSALEAYAKMQTVKRLEN